MIPPIHQKPAPINSSPNRPKRNPKCARCEKKRVCGKGRVPCPHFKEITKQGGTLI